jgi:hypothetical protein
VLLPLLLLFLWATGLGCYTCLRPIERAEKAIDGSQGRWGLVLLKKREHELTLYGLLALYSAHICAASTTQ